MTRSASKSEANRQTGKHQVDEQRACILDAAERLFLQNGLQNTRMVDIAAQAGITKVTLYRYFPNRDVIAVEVHARMMERTASLVNIGDVEPGPEAVRRLVRSMIRNFDSLRDAYRLMGMFDQLYLDNPPNAALTQWTKNQLLSLPWKGAAPVGRLHEHPQGGQLVVVLSTVVWFLEKLALRGELTWSDQAVPLEEHLKLFEDMIMGYLDRVADAQPVIQ
jgi:AcrR family transcriptional regulator